MASHRPFKRRQIALVTKKGSTVWSCGGFGVLASQLFDFVQRHGGAGGMLRVQRHEYEAEMPSAWWLSVSGIEGFAVAHGPGRPAACGRALRADP